MKTSKCISLKQPKPIAQSLPIHPFPARMAPSIVADYLANAECALRVLDPMVGSGTVLAVARASGHRAIGFDLDPLAVLLARVWTTSTPFELVRAQGALALRKAERLYRHFSLGFRFPAYADDETCGFISYWFDAVASRQLTALSFAIAEVEAVAVRDFLWCCFSRLIITKQSGASRAMDLSHSRPHRVFLQAPALPFTKFLESIEQVVARCIDSKLRGRGPATVVKEGDARSLPLIGGSVDLVVTSPPYLNAIDYMRCSKFSLIWMGYQVHELRRIRGESVGTEVGQSLERSSDGVKSIVKELGVIHKLPARNASILARYVDDMVKAVSEVSRVLVPGGKAIYVLGENIIRGCFIHNSRIVASAGARVGLRVLASNSRELPPNRRYLPPPIVRKMGATLDTRMSREIVLTLEKQG